MHNNVSGAVKKGLIVAVSITAAFAVALMIYGTWLLNGRGIHKGITIEGVKVSGMDKAEAARAVTQELKRRYPVNGMNLTFGDKQLKIGYSDLDYRFLVDDAVDKAYSIGRTGSMTEKLKVISAAAKGHNIKVEDRYDNNKLDKLLLKIKSMSDKPAKNAQIAYKSGKVNVLEGCCGASMDIDINKKLLENQIVERKFDNLVLELKEVVPAVSAEKINKIDSVLSAFSTRFNTGDTGRTYNIRLACSKINGELVMPGELFSMNRALGPRTAENGYREAPVIFKNELVKGTGGGICQVTTTLYNAVLMSCLEVIERTPHSMTLGYVKPGQDATILEGILDFRFRNNTDYPICINADASSNVLNIRILGKKSQEGRVVKLTSQIIKEYPPEGNEILQDETLTKGQSTVTREPKKGVRAVLTRDIYDTYGTLVRSERISEDFYKPVRGQILVSPEDYKLITGS